MLRIVTAPTADPVSLAEAKAQLRVTDTSSDLVIQGLIPAATMFVQSLVQRVYMTQTLEWVLPHWHARIELPIAPVKTSDVVSVKYVDWVTQAQQTLDPSLYVPQTKGESVAIIPKFGTIWPLLFTFAPEPLVIRFTAGYADPASVPANVKAAILLLIRHLYSLGENNPTLRKDTVFGVGAKEFQLTPEVATLIPDAVRNLMFSEVW
jgi:uncharacterized phiE125 gp8 family phage protein